MTESAAPACWDVYAIRYATNTKRTRNACFVRDAEPDALLAMDFYSWLLIGGVEAIVIDTGMAAAKCAQNGHEFLVDPVEVIRKLGVDPAAVRTVVMTHLHYDHTGNTDAFPKATFHLQAEEMSSVTGPMMEKPWLRHAYHVEEIQKFVGYLYEGRLRLHGRDHDVADGVSVHWVGGHAPGQEVVRVRTKRGWVVLASDALHYIEEYTRSIPYSVAFDVPDMLRAHDRIRDLADGDDHVIAAHDPLLKDRFPAASPDLEDVAIRVDLAPLGH